MVTLHSIRDEVRQGTAHQPPLVLDFAALRFHVASNSPELLRRLDDYFRPFVSAPSPHVAPEHQRIRALQCAPPLLDVDYEEWPREPGKKRRKEEFAEVEGLRVVRKVRTDMQFICGGSDHDAFGPCLENVNQIINFIGTRVMSWYLHRGWQLCHAAGICDGGAGLAIAGLSGGGKSTLALHLMRRGVDYVSNDRVLLRSADGVATMVGVPKLPRINPGTALNNPSLVDVLSPQRAAELRRLALADLWDLEEKYDVDIERAFGAGRMQPRAVLRGVVVLNWQRDAGDAPRLQAVDLRQRDDLLGALMKAAGPFYAPAGAGPPDGRTVDAESTLRHLQNVPVYEMVGRVDFPAAVEQCAALLRPELPLKV